MRSDARIFQNDFKRRKFSGIEKVTKYLDILKKKYSNLR